MAKGYWVSVYPAISDPERLTAYFKLAGPAVQARGGRTLSRGGRVVAHEAGIVTRHHGITGAARLVILLLANIGGFGVLWVAKYIVFNKVLFVVRHHPDERAGAGRG